MCSFYCTRRYQNAASIDAGSRIDSRFPISLRSYIYLFVRSSFCNLDFLFLQVLCFVLIFFCKRVVGLINEMKWQKIYETLDGELLRIAISLFSIFPFRPQYKKLSHIHDPVTISHGKQNKNGY